jgi:transglutaminase-like putative cysteine protease
MERHRCGSARHRPSEHDVTSTSTIIDPLPSPTPARTSDDIPAELHIGCRFVFDVPRDVHTVAIVEPHTSERARVLEERFEEPAGSSSTTFRDGFGNRCRRLHLPAGLTTFAYDAVVTNTAGFDATEPTAVQHDPSQLPDDTLSYLLPSRYCPSDDLADTAVRLFGTTPAGWELADTIATWTHQHLAFGYGTSSPSKTAADALTDRTGVCRDFAHVMITMCRASNIPARYVVGYLPDIAVPDPGSPMDFCAWTEVYLGDRWYTFDPRNHHQRRIGRTVIARGRDAADVAMTTTFGDARLREMVVHAEAAPQRDAIGTTAPAEQRARAAVT